MLQCRAFGPFLCLVMATIRAGCSNPVNTIALVPATLIKQTGRERLSTGVRGETAVCPYLTVGSIFSNARHEFLKSQSVTTKKKERIRAVAALKSPRHIESSKV